MLAFTTQTVHFLLLQATESATLTHALIALVVPLLRRLFEKLAVIVFLLLVSKLI